MKHSQSRACPLSDASEASQRYRPHLQQLADDLCQEAAAGDASDRRNAITRAQCDLRNCLAFGEFLTDFQLGMLPRAPWTADQYDAIEEAEIQLSRHMADALDRLSTLSEVR